MLSRFDRHGSSDNYSGLRRSIVNWARVDVPLVRLNPNLGSRARRINAAAINATTVTIQNCGSAKRSVCAGAALWLVVLVTCIISTV
jgi:hypothetical protein